MSDINRAIYEAVKARGYLDGYTDVQLFARQVCKLQEELAELTRDVVLPVTTIGNAKGMILSAGLAARQIFDTPDVWSSSGPLDHTGVLPRLYMELADCYVVLAVMEQTLARIAGVELDIQAIALTKAQTDIERGVR